MKVSLSWLRNYLDFDLPEVDQLIELIGAQLGAVETVENLGPKYQGILIVKVVEVSKHPNADKLSICLIDDDGKTSSVERDSRGLIQVVCGAPNVAAGQYYAYLPPGSTVPASFGSSDPLVIEKRTIRDVVSNGMLASSKELDFGDSHDGLLELGDKDLSAGADFSKTFELDDTILDIENKMFTHRPDCFGMLGVAREVAGILHKPYTSPPIYSKEPPQSGAKVADLKIDNQLPELVPRFVAQVFTGVRVGPSPAWLQTVLSRVGLRPINNVVDITNYLMYVTGQPLHAYDYDKVKALSSSEAVICVRQPAKGEKIALLNGKTIEPRPEAIMIATDKQLIGMGGVMGGSQTEVDLGTKNIILESATFDMYSIRRTSMFHGLFSDAVTRFSKNQSPLQNRRVVAWAEQYLSQITGATAGSLIDDNQLETTVLKRDSVQPAVSVAASFINSRLGSDLSAKQMADLLENVEFKVELKGPELVVTAPFWRTDIELAEDIVEEVGRLHGYDNLPIKLPQRDLRPTPKNPLLAAKDEIRNRLVRAGANEVLTYSFVSGDLLDSSTQDKTKAYQLANALSPELQYYRLSLLPSLLDKVQSNIKAGHNAFALFEIGKNHSLDQPKLENDLPVEYQFTALVVAAADKLKPAGSPYYLAKKYLEEVAGVALLFKPISKGMLEYPVSSPYEPKRSAAVYLKDSGEFLGLVGEIKASIKRKLKLPGYTAGLEVDSEVLGRLLSQPAGLTPLSSYPKLTQDITLQLPEHLSYQEAFSALTEAIEANKPADSFFSLEPKDIYQPAAAHKNITWHLAISSYKKTLADSEINQLLVKIDPILKTEIKAQRI